MTPPLQLVRSVLGWPVETQLGSRRNAMVASSALTELRREREEVEDFLEAHAARWSAQGSSQGSSPWSAPLAAPAPQAARRDVI